MVFEDQKYKLSGKSFGYGWHERFSTAWADLDFISPSRKIPSFTAVVVPPFLFLCEIDLFTFDIFSFQLHHSLSLQASSSALPFLVLLLVVCESFSNQTYAWHSVSVAAVQRDKNLRRWGERVALQIPIWIETRGHG